MPSVISWVRWEDPFAPDVKPRKPEEDEWDANFHKAMATHGPPRLRKPGRRDREGTGPVVFGPFGIVPLRESNLPSALFNFWVGHANFDVTENVAEAISKVPGIETLDVFTRYRFRVGIGKSFREEEVKGAVEKAVCRHTGEYAGLKTMLAAAHPHWAIGVAEDGRTAVFGGKSRPEVSGKVQAGGEFSRVIKSWD